MSTIEVFDDVVMPELVLLAGVTGTRSRKNIRGINQGGYANVTAVRDFTMQSYQIATEPMLSELASAIIGIIEVTDSGVFGFLIEDPLDSRASALEGGLQGYMLGVEYGTVGFGNGCPTYGFRKIYIAYGSTRKRARAVTRLHGSATMLRGGSPIVVGVAAGNVAVSSGIAYVTFVADASRTVSAVAVGATTQVTLSSTIPGFAVGGRLWLQDLTGADAALLNNQSHQITAITGGGLNVYTLATSTAGKTITAAGTGKKYPQPDEALTAAFRFYTPVHFRDDDIQWELLAGGPYASRMVSFTSVYLDEIREA